ncbi:divalent-cation tolerance protein CutA [Leptospira biflexa]|uniref:divalent-cation tolerance protein CutA n=1 Tax=Leptospira biflexa TaxID=172 RepID=UPI00108280BC|nr:divalent-cation tolerance protein CutA [Leptospira biflexa]TGM32104.1 divalent-cation tolerance protein CutA [Leptospira biflexa]TGM42082.1 divalent-cation tolerance protein CutA [Leptospira biflexa]TGM42852.1 divalent-cation tolerance protein CutA [Leptospira biflexa]TGM45930.1 divalent-cation tolerance protein CutA [Leptospira biflexa]TGM51659.1 divalent-cation tolerance protein CutA [Leptospira biflexa]
MASEEILVFTTIGDRDMAEEHISEMLEQGIIISGTIFPEVELVYLWEGKITVDTENKILLKTTADKYDAIETYIQKRHPYIAPEIIRMDVSFGSPAYKAFVADKIKKNS